MRLLINGESAAIQVPVLSQMSANESASMNLLARWWKRPKKLVEKQNLSKSLNGTSGHLYLYLLTSFLAWLYESWPLACIASKSHLRPNSETTLLFAFFILLIAKELAGIPFVIRGLEKWSNNLAPNPESRPISSPLAASSSWNVSVFAIPVNHYFWRGVFQK